MTRLKRVAIYTRVSTDGQSVENQRRELLAVAERRGWEVAQEYSDHGISGAKDRDKRPAFDRMLKGCPYRKRHPSRLSQPTDGYVRQYW